MKNRQNPVRDLILLAYIALLLLLGVLGVVQDWSGEFP